MDDKLRRMAAKAMVCRHCCCIINDLVKCSTYGKAKARLIKDTDKLQYCHCTEDGRLSPSKGCISCGGVGIMIVNKTCL